MNCLINASIYFHIHTSISSVSVARVSNIKLLDVRIANHTVLGSSTTLECTYDLQGENLYSVKWYKDGDEFFRYLPKSVPEIQVFEKQGIYIDVSINVCIFLSNFN